MKLYKVLFSVLLVSIATLPLAAQNASGSNDQARVTIGLVAKDFAFETSTITVAAGAKVTINFDNQDKGVPHNLSVYYSSAAKKAVFKGEVITGTKQITYTFTAPQKAGTYFFRCDVHPKTMTGTFVVQ